MFNCKMLYKILPLLVVSSFMYSGCGKKQEAPPPAGPVPVTVAKVEIRDVPVSIKAVGQVDAFSTIEVKTQITGVIDEVYFKEGQLVKKGAKLLQIDPRPFQATLNQVQANLERDRFQAENFRRVANRTRALFERGAATRDELDTVTATANAQEATVRAEEAAVVNARLQLSYCDIRSPVDGIAGFLLVDVGNLAKANDVSLVDINQIEPILVTFAVPQQDLPRIRDFFAKGPLAVKATSPADPNLNETGTLTLIDNKIDPSTGTIKMRATFANANHQLWPGQFVSTDLVITIEKNMIVVPASALQASQEGPYIWIVKDGVAQMQQVKAGRLLNGYIIILQGLEADETVVVDGQLRLIPGSKIVEKPPVVGLPPISTTAPTTAASAPESKPSTMSAGPTATSAAASTEEGR